VANRCLLHRTKLDLFKAWLVKDGWVLDENYGDYQVLRARKGKRFVALYDRHQGDHFSMLDRDHGLVRAFIRDTRAVGIEAQHTANL
jgi:hypothetical protein